MEAKVEAPLNNNETDIQAAKLDKSPNIDPPSNNVDVLSSVSNMYNNAKDSISNYSATESVKNIAETASIENAKEAVTDMLNGTENIFYLIILVVIIAIIAGYFLYYAITDNILYQQKIEVDGTETPILCNSISEFKIIKSLINSNGIKRTYGFWIYINDITKYNSSTQYRHIAHIGKKHAQIKEASPYIFLDGQSNTMYVRFAPRNDIVSDGLNNHMMTNKTTLFNYRKTGAQNITATCVISVPYIPIQRWVHIVIVVSDANDGIVHIYIDGELHKSDERLELYEHDFESQGNLYTGGHIANTMINTNGFSGLISKFTLYNYDLNKNDVYKEYNKGPINSLFASMGLGAATGVTNYGLRNPIYKLNNVN